MMNVPGATLTASRKVPFKQRPERHEVAPAGLTVTAYTLYLPTMRDAYKAEVKLTDIIWNDCGVIHAQRHPKDGATQVYGHEYWREVRCHFAAD